MPRDVNESLVEYLNMEIIAYALKFRDSGKNEDTTTVKLESMGVSVGEKLVERITRDRQRFQDTLDIVKWLCKEFWTAAFRKQVDNLKTNHKGIFVIFDNRFHWLTHVSMPENKEAFRETLAMYTTFFCGIIKGALGNLGVAASVTADASALPACAQFPLCVFGVNMK